MDFIGQCYLKIHMSFVLNVLNVNKSTIYLVGYNASRPNTYHQNLWHLEDWLYGSISYIIWFPIILLMVDYISKWVEAMAIKINDSKVVVHFIKDNIFCRFGTPQAIISDEGKHFCNWTFKALIKKYSITYRVDTAYHPQTQGQIEVSN